MCRLNFGVVTGLTIFDAAGSTFQLKEVQYIDNDFIIVNPIKERKGKQFSYFSEPEEEDSDDVKPELSDPAQYYAKIQGKRRNKKPFRRRMQGSYSSYKKSENNQLKYAFLKPQTYKTKESKDCKPASPISAFTFMNFAMAAVSVAANIIANVNDNNNNNNNNNNDNNDNSNNFNIENNSNNGNNANTIMLPLGKKRKRRMIKEHLNNFQNIVHLSLVNSEARDILEICLGLVEDHLDFCKNKGKFTGLVVNTFQTEIRRKACPLVPLVQN